MLNIVLWKWKQHAFREQYTAEIANTLIRQLPQRHRMIVVTDDPRGVGCETFPLWNDYRGMWNISGQHLPSCYRRLKLFDPATTRSMGIPPGEWVVSMDLDAVVTGDLDEMLTRGYGDSRIVAWVIKGARRERVINGSLFMFRAGDLEDIWRGFDPNQSPMKSYNAGFMGSDQGFLSYCLIDKDYLGSWARGDVLSFTRDVVQAGIAPKTGRVVFFAGARKPWHDEVRKSAPWIQKYVERVAA